MSAKRFCICGIFFVMLTIASRVQGEDDTTGSIPAATGGAAADTTTLQTPTTDSAAAVAAPTTAPVTAAAPSVAPDAETTVGPILEETTPQTPGVICRNDVCDDVGTSTTAGNEVTTESSATTAPAVDDLLGSTASDEETTKSPGTTVSADLPATVAVDDDPCSSHLAVKGSIFTEEKPSTDVDCFGLFESPSGWIKFYLDDEDDVAEIPTVPIKQDYCGAHFAFHVNLDKEMPSTNETESAHICSYLKGEVDQPCANTKKVEVHNCNDDFFVYKFDEDLREEELCKDKGGSNVCLKRPGEEIPYEYQSMPDPTTTAAGVVDNLPRLHDLTEEEENGTLTIEYHLPEDVDPDNCTGFWIGIDPKFRQMIADALNSYLSKPPAPIEVPTTTDISATTPNDITTRIVPDGTTFPVKKTTTPTTPAPTEPSEFIVEEELVLESSIEEVESLTAKPPVGAQPSNNMDNDAGDGPGKRDVSRIQFKRDVSEYTKDDVYYVYDTPQCVSGLVQVSFVVVKDDESESNRTRRSASGGNVVPQSDLDAAVSDMNKEQHKNTVDLEYNKHYQGAPQDPEGKTAEVVAAASIWDAHMGLFIAVIVLLLICLIVIIVGILCIKCKGRKSKPEKTPLRAEEGHSPMVIENPVSDEEITRGEAPMTEAPNPAYTPNGSGHHLTKADEDNGWVVPLNDLSYDERGRPEVENTKL